ncbi:MAG: choice-of-anchor V domain-containing protein [Candidatus Kapaibacterium sp.]|nr:T9SS type A sorting domain-containing protein [Bacteroidota bacterium]
MKKIVFLSSLFFVAVTVAYLGAKSSGAHPGSTGAPGEKTCADAITGCHEDATISNGTNVNSISINDNLQPEYYQNDSVYTINLRIQESTGKRFGFEIVALDDKNLNIGKFLPPVINNKRTQIISNAGRSYVTHTSAGISPTTTGENEWTFGWQAPHDNQSAVHFYYITNACNGDAKNTGDKLYKSVLNVPNKLNTNNVDDNTTNVEGSLHVFPNPASNIINVTIPVLNSVNIPLFSIVDVQGNTISTVEIISYVGNSAILSLPNQIPNGTYILRMNNNSITLHQKLVISH